MSFQPGRRQQKRRSNASFLTRDQVRAAYLIYVGKEIGLLRLGNLLYERFGYSSPRSCADSLWKAFHLEGYQLRERVEASALAQLRHGMARRSGDKKPYQRWLRRQRGEMRAACRAIKSGAAGGKGQPCSLPAKEGSEYCVSHDPERPWQAPQYWIERKEQQCRNPARPGRSRRLRYAPSSTCRDRQPTSARRRTRRTRS